MKIINKLWSMRTARCIRKSYRFWKKARIYLDSYIEESCRLTFYIVTGFEEPTRFVSVATIGEKEHIITIFNLGVISEAEITKAVEMIQTVSKSPKPWGCPILFAVRNNNMKQLLQDNGVYNVIVPTWEEYEKALKAIDSFSKEK